MQRVISADGTTVSYDKYGSGPPLVLVHGGFSDHITNWQECKSLLERHFTVHAIARRGRGETTATQGHSVADEDADIVAVLRQIGEPAFLLGHSYGGVCALNATAQYPEGVSKLVLYEPPKSEAMSLEALAQMEEFGEAEDWEGMVEFFMLDVLQMPSEEVAEIKTTPFWDTWIIDAKASLNDMRALVKHTFDAKLCRNLSMPVLFLVGSESPRDLYRTDILAANFPDNRVVILADTAHEGMTMAPEQFVEKVSEFLLGVTARSA